MKILTKKNALHTTLIAGCALGAMTFFTSSAQACSENTYIGSICATSNFYCPSTYAEADGSLITITSNQALYALLGVTFGGDGRTYFALPDLRSRTPVSYAGPLQIQMGTKPGAETVTLSTEQMATHDHTATFSSTGSPSPKATVPASTTAAQKETPAAGDLLAATAVNGYIPAANVGSTATVVAGMSSTSKGGTLTVGNTGSAAPFSIISPQTAVKYCIKMTGLWPPRS